MDTTDRQTPRGPAPAEEEMSVGWQAVLAFRRDLPRLLQERPDEWVAYHGPRQIGFAKNPIELYKQCARLGIPDDEFIVCSIEPLMPDEVDSPYPFE